ncbi:alkaline phosphatase family protein [Stackebrandtia nassauensis]|uniref:Type I phosphodiesterase/nucleotide pyrophosphatase n=1 Tax=Stackebrandtia nassauensis (strain DSM 44728 / CIP 108903 / NRRL B-16338 / NBRC 102104 / LLR-40K-21) TaxID=446470 RepID=D3Q9L8_STANL|nr:nucleotide pyrophosphatase/phosphodiesterase family protein [Stackebrandtia nassauensis]ADD44564.1 type I phosphodiesterase/nucleotide pyrophosphatase [Stackebrandtia nassauensis DSM 44728]
MEIDAELYEPASPRYGEAALSDILPSVLAALKVPDGNDVLGLADAELADIRRVVVLLVDGLGYHLLREAAASSEYLAAAVDGELGTLRELTTNYPSTTPTSIASLNTGVAPGQHGLTGFTVNIPGTEDMLTHIAWGPDGPDPRSWQPVPTCYERAAAAGVATTIVHRPEFVDAGLTEAIFRGGAIAPADSLAETAQEVHKALSQGDRSLVYCYYGYVDKRGHGYGPGSAPWHAAVANVNRLLRLITNGLPADAALLVTADHGMIEVPREDHIDLADHPHLRDGVRLVVGEPRSRYVHTRPGAVADVAAAWRETLGDRVEVLTRDEAVATGRFGTVTPEHLPRIGDVVVTGNRRHVIIGGDSDIPPLNSFVGFHGGLTAAELAIPLWSYRVS